MGSEIVVLLAPVGLALLLFFIYRSLKGPYRVYPVSALVAALACTAYLTYQAHSHYTTWFLIWFALVSVPVGAVAHFAKWLIGVRNART